MEVGTLDKNSDNSNYLLTYTNALLIVIYLCDYYKKSSSLLTHKKQENELFNALEYIHTNYNSKITLKILCSKCLMSKTVMLEKFNKYFNLTPLAYVNSYRIQVAKKLLLDTDKSIGEIALECGFFDTSHFIKTFIKYEKISPKQFKTKNTTPNL